ncbi:MAG: 4Fe-4S dicluster domain-containing protein [Spirochaetales bacterium]|nr:4Fe-4S dicluster domain-containing protein [Spirochaetales bacterium]
MEILKISLSDFLAHVNKKIQAGDSKQVGVVPKGSHFVFGELDEAAQLCLDYDVTILPPKKYFQPQREVLVKYAPKDASSYAMVNDCENLTLIGVHPYDLVAIHLMDRAFSEGERDENYMAKRDCSVLIGLYPTRGFEHRFSASMIDPQMPYKVADLMLIKLDDNQLALEVVSKKGKAYLEGAAVAKSDLSEAFLAQARNKVKDSQAFPLGPDKSPAYFKEKYEHPVWEKLGEKCYSCGSCVFVCPTCYCFDVRDEVELSLASGERVRYWDGCMIESFAICAGDHNFRKERGARFRHRVFRKTVTLPEKYQVMGCVGCGRCAQACTADIAGPMKVIKTMKEMN